MFLQSVKLLKVEQLAMMQTQVKHYAGCHILQARVTCKSVA